MYGDNKFYMVTKKIAFIFGKEQGTVREVYSCKINAVREACKQACELIEEAMFCNENVSCFFEGDRSINLMIFGEEEKRSRRFTFTIEELELND